MRQGRADMSWHVAESQERHKPRAGYELDRDSNDQFARLFVCAFVLFVNAFVCTYVCVLCVFVCACLVDCLYVHMFA